MTGRLAALLLLIPLTSVAGQGLASAAGSPEHLEDSLASSTDTASLHAQYRTTSRQASKTHDPGTMLHAALLALRAGELGDGRGTLDAIKAARNAINLDRRNSYAWYLLGRAESRRAVEERSNRLALGSRIGVGTLERSAGHFAQALSLDPGNDRAAVALGAVLLSLHDTALYVGGRDALRHASGARRSANVLLALGRLERASGETDSALVDFEAAWAAGGARAICLLEIARTKLAMGGRAGMSEYFEGASDDDSATVAQYRADITPIATESELARFDAAHGMGRPEFLRRFWAERDMAELRSEGERLTEHFRRLLYARRHFGLTISRRFYGSLDAYRSGSEELDDRGVIYVRHGEPAGRLRPFVFGLMPNETWRYDRADGDLLFHFSAGSDDNGGGDLYDYRLVESVLDLHGASRAPADQLLLSRQSLSPVYARMLNWGRFGAARSRARERAIGQASIAFGTSTDSYELQFAHRLSVVGNLIAIGGSAHAPLAHFVFAVAPPDSQSVRHGGEYRVRVRLAALDSAGHAFATKDTTVLTGSREPLQRGKYLLGRAEMPLPPGNWSWRAAVQIGDSAGAVLARDTVHVARRDRGLSLSDLAVGVIGAGAIWVATPEDTAYMTPFGLARSGSDLELYYEAAGAVPRDSYTHEIAVYRLKGEPSEAERRPVVRLSFTELASDSVIRARRTLRLNRVKPGRYLVEVRIGGPDGEAVLRRREIRVLDEKPPRE